MSAYKTGTVLWFNEKKGFGYAKDEDGKHVFIHYSDIKSRDKYKKLDSGDTINFDLQVDGERLRAANIRRAKTLGN